MDRLRGKKALVIGGSTGIGAAICRRFAEEGADVAIASPAGETEREELAAALKAAGHDVLSLAVDVCVEQDVRMAVEETLRAFGAIDILVNNAGIGGASGPLWEKSVADYEAVMAVNVRGVWFGMKHVLPHMVERRYGRIVNTASQLAHKPSPNNAVYCASKAAVVAMTVSTAQEVAPMGITVNALCPGATQTPMWDQNPREWADWKLNSLPMRRIGQPDDQAWACVYLASDEAAYVTGQSLSPNGGDVMW